jgi:hypothetical protein
VNSSHPELTTPQEITPDQEPTLEADASKGEDIAPGDDGEMDCAEKDANGQPLVEQSISQTPGFVAGFGFDPNAASGFPGMGFGGDFNQMQMMIAMQNGMGQNGFNNFPMMGMSYSRSIVGQNQANTRQRNAWNGHGSNDDAEHVYEWWFWCGRHGHERHEHGNGRWWLRWWSW